MPELLYVEHAGPVEDQWLQLGAGLHVLFGRNGAGKSSVLNLLLQLLHGDDSGRAFGSVVLQTRDDLGYGEGLIGGQLGTPNPSQVAERLRLLLEADTRTGWMDSCDDTPLEGEDLREIAAVLSTSNHLVLRKARQHNNKVEFAPALPAEDSSHESVAKLAAVIERLQALRKSELAGEDLPIDARESWESHVAHPIVGIHQIDDWLGGEHALWLAPKAGLRACLPFTGGDYSWQRVISDNPDLDSTARATLKRFAVFDSSVSPDEIGSILVGACQVMEEQTNAILAFASA